MTESNGVGYLALDTTRADTEDSGNPIAWPGLEHGSARAIKAPPIRLEISPEPVCRLPFRSILSLRVSRSRRQASNWLYAQEVASTSPQAERHFRVPKIMRRACWSC